MRDGETRRESGGVRYWARDGSRHPLMCEGSGVDPPGARLRSWQGLPRGISGGGSGILKLLNFSTRPYVMPGGFEGKSVRRLDARGAVNISSGFGEPR